MSTTSKLSVIVFSLMLMMQQHPYAQAQEKPAPIDIGYGSDGIDFSTADDRFSLQIQSRLQFRYSVPNDEDPITFDDFQQRRRHTLAINRARLKVGGHAFQPWLKYYWEYELSQNNLLDFRVMVEKWSFFNILIGQWKTEYGRERDISSGEQQMLERSLINRPFTIDRQQGISFYGRLQGGGRADFNYWFSILTGTGRGESANDDDHLLYAARLQWNFTGRFLEITGSDVDFHEEGAGSLALGATTNRSPYTRFSQAGGGHLEGFEEELPGQYRTYQWMAETAWMKKGFAWQQEFHWKRIHDLVNEETTTMLGNYVQAGYFFHYLWDWVPQPLELAARYTWFKQDLFDASEVMSDEFEQEFALAANWFFHGHLNKLTADVTYLRFTDDMLEPAGNWRFRLQWDISF